ncbi:MAG TPA: SseB family protein, partial [Bdellovibrionota bacterium]|nr:SseB family protein [Bdellovibrionota bacterium]
MRKKDAPSASDRAEKPSNSLEFLLDHAAKDPSQRTKFFRALMESDLYVVGRTQGMGVTEDDGAIRSTGKLSLQFALFEDGEGRRYIPAYTSRERLETALTAGGVDSTETGYLKLAARALFESRPDECSIHVNAGFAHGVFLEPQHIEALLEGKVGPVASTLEPGTRLALTQLSEADAPLAEVLGHLLRARTGRVEGAFLALEGRQPFLGISCPALSERQFEELVDEVSSAAGPALKMGQALRVVRIAAAGELESA